MVDKMELPILDPQGYSESHQAYEHPYDEFWLME